MLRFQLSQTALRLEESLRQTTDRTRELADMKAQAALLKQDGAKMRPIVVLAIHISETVFSWFDSRAMYPF